MVISIERQIENLHKFATVPVYPNTKIPATESGYKSGREDAPVETYLKLGYNVGISLLLSRLICIDVDMHGNSDGLANFAKLEKELGSLPNSYRERTATGNGLHILARDYGITNPRGELCPGVEIKYKSIIVCAPSIINGVRYEVTDGIDEQGNWILPSLPQNWLNAINKAERIYSPLEKSQFSSKPIKYKNANIEAILEKCNFLKVCADEDNASVLPYPMWFSAISTLAQIDGSDEFIHTISEPHPKYSHSETQKMIERARDFGHPHTCEYISANFPEMCGNCQSKTIERKK